ncbi:NAD(P)H-dependent oxidoreductase [Sphingomonas cannabina]|uniref:NAD(P)H-dependent oxidoreductase n=1 Tax=Sphingomonas cannabina TaxID=2899123 RepID=UPI001F1C8127|nr:NAD(P)H-dependent oxidoreductase [Sphingomonas cannabina]UIJ46324.1 NAD(P)H-dependent oxidoreductase [Sphingomonas cannabina]
MSQVPIRHLVVLGHPAPGSFNHTVAQTYCETVEACCQQAEVRDLYAIGFDPLLKADERPAGDRFEPAPDVAAELALLRECDVVTLIYPLWFGMPPAIIKGYIDRVLGAGFGPSSIKHDLPNPMLRGKHLMILSSSATTRPWLEEHGQWVSLRQAFDTYLSTIFAFASDDHVHFDAIVSGTKAQYIEECLEQARERTRLLCAKLLNAWHRREQAHVCH